MKKLICTSMLLFVGLSIDGAIHGGYAALFKCQNLLNQCNARDCRAGMRGGMDKACLNRNCQAEVDAKRSNGTCD